MLNLWFCPLWNYDFTILPLHINLLFYPFMQFGKVDTTLGIKVKKYSGGYSLS